MAGNKTSPFQAEQAARVNKARKATASANQKNAAVTGMPSGKAKGKKSKPTHNMRGGITCLCLLVLLCGMATNPEGKILQWLRDGLLGFFGKGSFYISIFGLFFLMVIHFGKDRSKLKARTLCMVGFILLFGVLQHLVTSGITLDNTPDSLMKVLWIEGIAGSSGGMICGGVGVALRYLLGRWMSILIIFVCWITTLLVAMNISAMSMLNAVRSRFAELG